MSRLEQLEFRREALSEQLRKLSWTREETFEYGSKDILYVERGLVDVAIEILKIEFILDKPVWNSNDEMRYGSKEQLRDEEEYLRNKEEQLRNEEEHLRMQLLSELKKQLRGNLFLILDSKISVVQTQDDLKIMLKNMFGGVEVDSCSHGTTRKSPHLPTIENDETSIVSIGPFMKFASRKIESLTLLQMVKE